MAMMNAFFVEKEDGKIYLIGYVSGVGSAIEPHKLPLGVANAVYSGDYIRQVQKAMRGTYGGKNCRGTFKSREWLNYMTRTETSARPEGPRWQYTFRDGRVYVSFMGGDFVPVAKVAPVTRAIEIIEGHRHNLWYAQHPVDSVTGQLGTKLYQAAEKTKARLIVERNKLFGLKARV